MTWKEFRDKVDAAILSAGLQSDDVVIWYFDLGASNGRIENLDVEVRDLHHPGEFEVWAE